MKKKKRTRKKNRRPDRTPFIFKIASSSHIQITIIAVAIFSVYGHTLDVPFYLDDFTSITENTAIHHLRMNDLWQFSPLRIVGYFTFALNYHWHQTQVAGYHLLNILIHFLAGCGVFSLAKGLILTPAMTDRSRNNLLKWFPFLTAIIFVIHPLQTQAVTYIIQRLASMAAMFYIASLTCYIHARLVRENRIRWLCISGTLVFGLLAFFTKQNTVTLPVAILVIEAVFFPQNRKRVVLLTGGIFIAIGMTGILSIVLGYDPFSSETIQSVTRLQTDMPRGEYFFTQFKVLWIYLRLFFLPFGLHLDYDIPPAPGFFDGTVICAMLGHLSLIIAAILVRKRLPVITFGLLFYYLAHSVESSIFPIKDLCFEHRTYLPNMGLCMSVGWLILRFMSEMKKYSVPAVSVLLFLFLMLGSMTWQRNQVWRKPIRFWEECTKYSPQKERPWNELANHLIMAGRFQEGVEIISDIINRQAASGGIHLDDGVAANFVIALNAIGRSEDALNLADNILKQEIRPFNRYSILHTKGNIWFAKKAYFKAESCYREAVRAFPMNLTAMMSLGDTLILQKRIPEAKEIFNRVLEKEPLHREARERLSLLSSLM